MIKWTDPDWSVSKFFCVKDALWLPQWKRLANEGDGLTYQSKLALTDLFERMDVVRDFIGMDIIVHCAFRPPGYNALVGGARNSAHMARIEEGHYVAAVDWHADVTQVGRSESCDVIREAIAPQLERWGLRMENNPLGSWIHTDTKLVPDGGNRIFKP